VCRLRSPLGLDVAVEERNEREHKEVEDASLSQQNALRSAEEYL
jgi:hypothetical protein